MKKFFTFFAAALTAITMSAANLTVAEALTIGQGLADNAESDTVVVEGFAVNVTPYDISFGNQQFYLADDATSTSSEFMVFRAKPTKNGVAYPVLAGDKVQLKGTIKKYVKDESTPAIIEIMYPSVTFVTEVAGDRTLATSTEITVAKALEIGATLGIGEKTTDTYDIVGYVTQIDNNSMDTYGNMEFWIADVAGTAASNAEGAFLVYRGKPAKAVNVGDKVSVKTIIQNYNGIIESNASVPVTLLQAGEGSGEGAGEGAGVVFTSAEFKGQGVQGTGGPVSAEKNGVTFTCDKGYGDQYGVRCYKGSNVTISATEQISKIVFEFATLSGTYYDGGLDTEIVVNGTEWTNTMASQARMNKITVYFGTAEAAKMDTLNAAGALAAAQALAENTTSDKLVVIAYVASIKTAYSEEYGNISLWLNDDPTSTYGDIQAYRATCSAAVGNAIMQGDKVMLVGKLTHNTYTDSNTGELKHSYQIAQGAELTLLATEGIEEVVLTENVQKVMVDGVLYIVRDNKMYNVQGVQVR